MRQAQHAHARAVAVLDEVGRAVARTVVAEKHFDPLRGQRLRHHRVERAPDAPRRVVRGQHHAHFGPHRASPGTARCASPAAMRPQRTRSAPLMPTNHVTPAKTSQLPAHAAKSAHPAKRVPERLDHQRGHEERQADDAGLQQPLPQVVREGLLQHVAGPRGGGDAGDEQQRDRGAHRDAHEAGIHRVPEQRRHERGRTGPPE